MFLHRRYSASFLLSFLLLDQCRAAVGLVHGHKHNYIHVHTKRHVHGSHVHQTEVTPQEQELSVETRSEEGLQMLQGGYESTPGGPLRFLNGLRHLPEDIEDNFREVKDILRELLQISGELKDEIESLRQSQRSTPVSNPASTIASTSARHTTTYTTRIQRTITIIATTTFATTTSATTSSSSSPPYTVPLNSSTLSWPTSTPISAFDARASNNIAVYYTQTSTGNSENQTELRLLCANPAVNIISLQLIATLNAPNGSIGFPTFTNMTDCTAPSPAQAANAPGLRDCSNLADTITYCQSLGKKIIIGIGSSHFSAATNSSTSPFGTTFNSSAQATLAANILLSLFGPPSNTPLPLTDLRPFGPTVSINGFDLSFTLNDPASAGEPTYHADFITVLRSYTSASDPDFSVSATQPCRRPVSATALTTLSLLDYLTIKFFDDPSCSIAGPGFNIWHWSQDLRRAANLAANTTSPNNNTSTGPKLFAAALAWPPAAAANGTGTSEGDLRYLGQSVAQIWGSGRLGNLGGVALVEGGMGIVRGPWSGVGGRSVGEVAAALGKG